MQISRAKLCDSITKLTHFGYHDTYPDLGEVMQAAVTELEWVVAENVDDKSIKSNTKDTSGSPVQYPYGYASE